MQQNRVHLGIGDPGLMSAARARNLQAGKVPPIDSAADAEQLQQRFVA
jgi:hypothetical protein